MAVGRQIIRIFGSRIVRFVRIAGETVPVLNPSLWPWWMTGLLALLAAEAAFAVVLFVTLFIVRSAHARHESRGLHFSRDYPALAAHATPTILIPD